MTRFVVAALLVLVSGGCGHHAPPKSIELPDEPYLGLACHDSTYPCHRLGLAVWLRRPATHVTATVDGQSVNLGTRPGRGPYRRGLFWQGFFGDRHAERYCSEYPHRLAVRIRISALDRSELVASGAPSVSCGYG